VQSLSKETKNSNIHVSSLEVRTEREGNKYTAATKIRNDEITSPAFLLFYK
jgi:hypothetical protein